MRIRRIKIARFRGIKELTASFDPNLTCLIGAGDSGKSTILGAIEVFCAPYNSVIDDSDFHDGKAEDESEIEVTITDYPQHFESLEVYGGQVRGWDIANSVIHDEPQGDDQKAFTIRLTIDKHLQKNWRVISTRDSKGIDLRSNDRNKLNAIRIGETSTHDFSWARGSLLHRLSEKETEAGKIIAEASRAARESAKAGFPTLEKAAEAVGKAGGKLGVQPQHSQLTTIFLRPKLAAVLQAPVARMRHTLQDALLYIGQLGTHGAIISFPLSIGRLIEKFANLVGGPLFFAIL